MQILSLIDKHYELNYPLNIRVVFERIMSVAHNVQGLYFEYASYMNFCIGLKGSMSWWSWGENVTISYASSG